MSHIFPRYAAADSVTVTLLPWTADEAETLSAIVDFLAEAGEATPIAVLITRADETRIRRITTPKYHHF